MADVEDFEVFARDAYGRLVGALSLYCGDAAVAEELAHDALVRAKLHWSRVRGMASPQGWLHRVGINLAHSWFRRRAAERRALQRHTARNVATSPPAQDAVVEALAVREALAGLSDRQRQALVLRFFLDWSVAETARTMGVSEGAVKSYCHRGLGALRERLGADVEVGR